MEKTQKIEKISLDEIYNELVTCLKDVADIYDLKFNRWCRPPNNVGRLYLNRQDRTAVCWIEENNSKHWIDAKIESNTLKESIKEVFTNYSTKYNNFYEQMEV